MNRGTYQVTIRGLLLLTFLTAAALTVWRTVNAPNRETLIRQALSRKYVAKNTLREGVLQFFPGTDVVELDLPAIRQANPDLQVFVASLETGYVMCYPKVQIAIASKHSSGKLQTAEFFSPTFCDSPSDFGKSFRGLRGATPADRHKIGKESSQVFQRITYAARISDEVFSNSDYRALLWHDRLPVGTIVVKFDQAGTVESVAIEQSVGG